MDIESTKVTAEEIAQFRAELAEDSKALADLNVIERCEGDLEQAARILARRADIEDVRAGITWESALKQARQVVCDAKFKEGLAPDLIGGIIGALITAGNPVLVAVATPCAGYIVKVSLAEFCNTDKSNPEI
ncbi:MAG: hypothetical protein IM466_07545 [Microcystis sp. M04BS1]|uniref:Uncharacterized protein n=1 Tax=Microcystis aeruginosa Ma_MB_S_20031200_S102 TaxID=2486254 RepID=A0A552EWH4_MICAE|nr:hypothetical protein [Microcystis sp. M04BS1]TRU20169.1 MAG: hypothetical protein EWV79_18460 [Microcystis aeruginosa Ma_MB_S_20031200_S102D]TRU38820.1 MAG: hypothetical protein EWV92_07660 [Microcystis aeruginosa Ma_MB_S_20031200_S102]